MSWLGEMPYPFKETLFRLYDAYSERYDFYESLGMGVGLKVPPPEVPYSATGMKYYMGDLVDSITSLLQKSLDTRKLGDWQIEEPFYGISKYESDGLVTLGVDAEAFFILDRPRLIADRRIVEAWYKVLNDYVRYPELPFGFAGAGIAPRGIITVTDWSEDKRYGGSRTVPYTPSASVPASTGYIAYFSSEQFRQGVYITEVTNESAYVTTGTWEIKGAISRSTEWWDYDEVNIWERRNFIIAMDGMRGEVSFPDDIIAAQNRILSYSSDHSDPSRARLGSSFFFGHGDDDLTIYKVSAENLPDPQYKYLDS